MNSFYSSLPLPVELCIAFGSGTLMILLSKYIINKISKLAGVCIAFFGASAILYGIIAFLDTGTIPDKVLYLLRLIASVIAILSFPLLLFSAYHATKNNVKLHKLMIILNWSTFIFFVAIFIAALIINLVS